MKKYKYLNKSQKILLAAMTIPLVVSVLPAIEDVHANNEIPTLRIYELNGSPKLEWATEILNENVLWQTNLDNAENVINLNPLYNGTGKQSFKVDVGNKVISLEDTITNNEGNHYAWPGSSYSQYSSMGIYDRLFIDNRTKLSVSFNARNLNLSENYIEANAGDNHSERGIQVNDDNGHPLFYDQNVNYSGTLPETIKIKTIYATTPKLPHGRIFVLATSKQNEHKYGIAFYSWDDNLKLLVKNKDTNVVHANGNLPSSNQYVEQFNSGNELLILMNVAVSFPGRKIENNDWETFNMNVDLNSDFYDFKKNGFNFSFLWKTNGEIQIDNIKFGYATEAEVFRDGQSIYRGYLADFHDTSIKDTVKPNKIELINTSISNDFNVNFNINRPQDNGTKVNYQIQSIAKNSTRSALSSPQEIEVKTDVVKYKYSISNQAIGTPTIETNSLNDIVIPLKSINLETDYLHIQAIDTNGNISDASSFKLNQLIDMQDLYNKIKELESSNNYNDFIDFINEIEQLYGDNLPQDLKEMIDKLGQHHGVNTSFLLLEEGEFTLKTSDIKSFGKVKLTAKKQTIFSDFVNDFGIIDARGTQEGWNVSVSATPFTVETFDGFVGTPHQLPLGSLALNAINTVEQVGTVHNSQVPEIKLNQLTAIDGSNTTINLLNAGKQKGMGEFKFTFGQDTLALTVDAITAKIDTVNYPTSNTPYASTVTWDLVSGPQI